MDITEFNGIGSVMKEQREKLGFSQEQVCHGICSVATFCRMECGERVKDSLTLQFLLDRLLIRRNQQEILCQKKDYVLQRRRKEIEQCMECKNYKKAWSKIEIYDKKYGKEKAGEEELHRQYVLIRKGILSRKPELLLEALNITAGDIRKRVEEKLPIGNEELYCLVELIHARRQDESREYEAVYEVYRWQIEKEKTILPSYFLFMEYYAEILLIEKKYEECLKICNEAIAEITKNNAVRNRCELFFLRGTCKKRMGERRKKYLRDYYTAYYICKNFGQGSTLKKIEESIRREENASL